MKSCGVAIVVFMAACEPSASPLSLPETTPLDRAREVRAIVRRHRDDMVPVVNLAVARVEKFFAARFANVERAVGELFSLRGKWRATFWEKEDYERFVRRTLERRLFSQEDYASEVLLPVREDVAYAWDALESRMLTEVHAFVGLSEEGVAFRSFVVEYEELMAELLPEIERDLGVNSVAIVGSEGVAMGVSVGLVAAGVFAANSWWNFGVSLAVGVAVGIVIEAVLGEVCEDVARMRLHAELVRLRREAVDSVINTLRETWSVWASRQEEAIVRVVESGRWCGG